MNGKLAKLLRKTVSFVPASTRTYSDKAVKTVLVPTGKLDDKGNAIMRSEPRYNRTATGQRASYQQLKRAIKAV